MHPYHAYTTYVVRKLDCNYNYCSRKQSPLRPGFASKIQVFKERLLVKGSSIEELLLIQVEQSLRAKIRLSSMWLFPVSNVQTTLPFIQVFFEISQGKPS